MPLSSLSMDIWSHIASFLPTSERISVFWSLRNALVIRTERSIFNTLMLFTSEAARAEQQRACENMGVWPEMPVWHPATEGVLETMGFDRIQSMRALIAAGGRVDLALVFLSLEQPNLP